MPIKNQQPDAVHPPIPVPISDRLDDLAGDLARGMCKRRFGLNRRGAAKVVPQSIGEGGNQIGKSTELCWLDSRVGARLDRQVARLVDELTPELSRFPPAVVRRVIAERDQRADAESKDRRYFTARRPDRQLHDADK